MSKTIYETRLQVREAIRAEYLLWLRDHMRQIVEQTGFERAELFTLEGTGEWVVQYTAPDRGAIEDYLANHAPKFRGDGLARFGDQVKIERRILIFQETFPT